VVDFYLPEVVTATDYYAFGQTMPGRTFSNQNFNQPWYATNNYRYAFNGKEHDSDGEFGSLTHYDYGFRIYNPSIGKFLSVDPLTASYPWYTPYQFAGNKPIAAIDLMG
jgi:RHS repeat-associated protein